MWTFEDSIHLSFVPRKEAHEMSLRSLVDRGPADRLRPGFPRQACAPLACAET